MSSYELRDPETARRFLLQGLWWQRVLPPTAATVKPALEWAMEIVSAGQLLPPLGVVADVGHVAFGLDWDDRTARAAGPIPELPANLVRTYEDHVLGKLYADWTFARASDALKRYQGRDRARGLAFFLDRFRERSAFSGVELPPGIIKALLDETSENVIAEGFESIRQDGVMPELEALYEALIAAARRTAEVLGPEDVFELEHRTALAELGERVALRQVLQAAASFEGQLPRTRPRPLARRTEVPTHILDEDTYPVGGFTSLSTRGSVESLLHSQLAYMESNAERPDLFDIKFLRDELLYYSRDENQFLRRRRSFVFVLYPDLVASRFKDAQLPYQRGVLLLSVLVVLVRRLTDWLSHDALTFEFLFPAQGTTNPLAAEQELLKTILREPIALGLARVEKVTPGEVAIRCGQRARRSLCQCLAVGVRPPEIVAEGTSVTRLQVDGARPVLLGEETEEGDEPLETWQAVLLRLLRGYLVD